MKKSLLTTVCFILTLLLSLCACSINDQSNNDSATYWVPVLYERYDTAGKIIATADFVYDENDLLSEENWSIDGSKRNYSVHYSYDSNDRVLTGAFEDVWNTKHCFNEKGAFVALTVDDGPENKCFIRPLKLELINDSVIATYTWQTVKTTEGYICSPSYTLMPGIKSSDAQYIKTKGEPYDGTLYWEDIKNLFSRGYGEATLLEYFLNCWKSASINEDGTITTTTSHNNNTVAEIIKWKKASSFVSLISLLIYGDSMNEFTSYDNYLLKALWEIVRDSNISGFIHNEEEYNSIESQRNDRVFNTEEEANRWINDNTISP